MRVRFHIDPDGPDQYGYRVSYEDEALYSDAGCLGIEACIVAATEGLGQDAVAAEVAYKGVISGTYALASLALAQIADHALQISTAIKEVFKSGPTLCHRRLGACSLVRAGDCDYACGTKKTG